MRFPAMGFRVMRFRAPSASPPGTADTGHPTAESQQAGLDHLMRIAAEQAAARLPGPAADRPGAEDACRTAPNAAEPGDDEDGTSESFLYM